MGFFPDNFQEIMAAQAAEGEKRMKQLALDYEARRIRPEQIGKQHGPVHAASILVWTKLAELARLPYIPAEVIATISMQAVYATLDGETDAHSPADDANFIKAYEYSQQGGYWRSEFCAGGQVKEAMGDGEALLPVIYFNLDDPRLIDMHYGMPELTVVGRPRLTPVRVNGYPVEFRVFNGTRQGVSFYYPQAGKFEITPELQLAMNTAEYYGNRLHAFRSEMGLVPWLPEMGPEDERIGSTIDFMLTQEQGLVLVDAGPGADSGTAHPCCFLDVPIEGQRWFLADGVKLR